MCSDALEPILQKLKLLEFGLFGLQQYGRNAALDVEDLTSIRDIFVHDRLTARTRMVSLGIGGSHADANSLYSTLSADGRHVAFWSAASNCLRVVRLSR